MKTNEGKSVKIPKADPTKFEHSFREPALLNLPQTHFFWLGFRGLGV